MLKEVAYCVMVIPELPSEIAQPNSIMETNLPLHAIEDLSERREIKSLQRSGNMWEPEILHGVRGITGQVPIRTLLGGSRHTLVAQRTARELGKC